MTAGEIVKFLKLLPKDTDVKVEAFVGEKRSFSNGQSTVVREAFEADGSVMFVSADNGTDDPLGVSAVLKVSVA